MFYKISIRGDLQITTLKTNDFKLRERVQIVINIFQKQEKRLSRIVEKLFVEIFINFYLIIDKQKFS